MRKPGAVHHARYMESCLYILKITMLQDNLPRGMLTANMKQGINRMAHYIALFHASYNLKVRIAPAAPRLDLKLWKEMSIYENIDHDVAAEVKQSLARHQWYLTEELVVFALFDKELPEEQKRKIASAHLQKANLTIFTPGKPAFSMILGNDDVELWMFIGRRSWLAFEVLNLQLNWIGLPTTQWSDDQEFLVMVRIISDLAVVNDTAERGVKDVEVYANVTNDEDQRGKIILVANSHRASETSGTFEKRDGTKHLRLFLISNYNLYQTLICLFLHNLESLIVWGSLIILG